MAQQFEEVGDMSLAKEYGQVYGLVMDLFDRIVALLGEEIMGQREYAEILDAGFAEIKVGLIPAVVDRIVVGDITRTRLSNIKVLFFAGVNDGIVPSVSGRGGILSEADRRALREMQVELAPTAREESFLQRFKSSSTGSLLKKIIGMSFSIAAFIICDKSVLSARLIHSTLQPSSIISCTWSSCARCDPAASMIVMLISYLSVSRLAHSFLKVSISSPINVSFWS